MTSLKTPKSRISRNEYKILVLLWVTFFVLGITAALVKSALPFAIFILICYLLLIYDHHKKTGKWLLVSYLGELFIKPHNQKTSSNNTKKKIDPKIAPFEYNRQNSPDNTDTHSHTNPFIKGHFIPPKDKS